MSEVKPYSQEGSKKEQVAQMFDNIAPSYDQLNHLFTLGIDKGWRKKMIQSIAKNNPKYILDVATGTGDVAIKTARMIQDAQIIGIDLSKGMLELGEKKVKEAGFSDRISFAQGDSEALNFDDNTFDAVTVAFGVRNFENLERGLAEMNRVLKPGGQAVVLEFSMPQGFIFKNLYKFYSKYIMPLIGKLRSGDKSAYSYLFESVQQFPYGQSFINILKQTGYKEITAKELFFGICTIYNGVK